MTESTKTRWYQFDLRFLFLAVTVLAVWLAWQYGRNNEANSPLSQLLKAGDVVRILEHGDTCSVRVYPSGATSSRLLTIERIDGDTIRLKGRNYVRVIKIASIRSVTRYEGQSQTASNGAGGGMGMGGGFNSTGGPMPGSAGVGMDAGNGGFAQPAPRDPKNVPRYPLPLDDGSPEGGFNDPGSGEDAPSNAPGDQPARAPRVPPAPDPDGGSGPSPASGNQLGGPLQSGGNRVLN